MKYTNPSAPKQVKALKRAIAAIKHERRAHFAAGEAAYQAGIRKDNIDDEGVKGQAFTFAEVGHAGYVQCTQDIQTLEDLIEIVTAEPAVIEQPLLFKKE
jgi:hypothetical protein